MPGAWPAATGRRQPGARRSLAALAGCLVVGLYQQRPRRTTGHQHPADSRAGQRKVWALALLGGQYAGLPAALVPFLGAALQAAWSHWLLSVPNLALKPGDSLSQCPACGSPAMAGVIRHRGKFNGLRYLVCSLCACEWHVVRVKCIYCEQSKGSNT
ncbi:formate dehydrogenase accessory protein FdhE [Pseudomonas sp. PCH446]